MNKRAPEFQLKHVFNMQAYNVKADVTRKTTQDQKNVNKFNSIIQLRMKY